MYQLRFRRECRPSLSVISAAFMAFGKSYGERERGGGGRGLVLGGQCYDTNIKYKVEFYTSHVRAEEQCLLNRVLTEIEITYCSPFTLARRCYEAEIVPFCYPLDIYTLLAWYPCFAEIKHVRFWPRTIVRDLDETPLRTSHVTAQETSLLKPTQRPTAPPSEQN